MWGYAFVVVVGISSLARHHSPPATTSADLKIHYGKIISSAFRCRRRRARLCLDSFGVCTSHESFVFRSRLCEELTILLVDLNASQLLSIFCNVPVATLSHHKRQTIGDCRIRGTERSPVQVLGWSTDLYKYSPDAVPPIHAVSYHVATDKPPPNMATSSGLFLATIYNQSQLA